VAAVQVEDVGETVLPLSLDGVIVGQEGMHDKVPSLIEFDGLRICGEYMEEKRFDSVKCI